MESTKAEYEDKAVLLGDSKYYLQTEEYKIEFLWTKLGNYAKDENVEIKIDVTNSQIAGRYNLNFEVFGQYTDVTQFIYDVENDSKLGFKIEDFKMQSGGTVRTVDSDGNEISSSSGVVGRFSCKEIRIDLKDVTTTTTATTENTTNETNETDETSETNEID